MSNWIQSTYDPSKLAAPPPKRGLNVRGVNRQRILDLVDADGDCWIWEGDRSSNGYGIFKRYAAHRLVWRILVGEIEPGLQLDHRCYTTDCVNPDHLEPVTPAENSRRRRWR